VATSPSTVRRIRPHRSSAQLAPTESLKELPMKPEPPPPVNDVVEVGAAPLLDAAPRDPPPPPPREREAEALKLAAVSYTHLRAHETSLHLVCRLLLEKK